MRTREWFEQAAASGDLIAAFNFGVCLAEGVGIERDDRKAAEWLRRAADGVVNAQYWYGRMLVEGRGVEANPEEGRAWITKAADVGMIEAEVMLADMMLTGRGGAEGSSGRAGVVRKAAERGHVGAMFAVGAMYGGGHEVPMDRVGGAALVPRRRRTRPSLCADDAGPLSSRNLAGVQDVGEGQALAGPRAIPGSAGRQDRPRRAAAGAAGGWPWDRDPGRRQLSLMLRPAPAQPSGPEAATSRACAEARSIAD